MSTDESLIAAALTDNLLNLGLRVREQIIAGRDLDRDPHAVGEGPGDTVFAIDRRLEPLVVAAMEALPEALTPALVICEGLGVDGYRRVGPSNANLRYRILIDPLDGTRSLAYDKRSGWFLAAAAPDLGEKTKISDAIASVMVELPTSKQGFADEFILCQGNWSGRRRSLTTDWQQPLNRHPSSESTLRHGFGHVSSFFPGTKRLAADLMEHIAQTTLGSVSVSEALVFDDQYICSGGQMVELMTGKDRFCCDLRPIFYEILRRRGEGVVSGLCCHPYDLAGAPIAVAAGVVLTDGYGAPFDAPFDVESAIHWCGYANENLREAIEPVIQEWIQGQFARRADEL